MTEREEIIAKMSEYAVAYEYIVMGGWQRQGFDGSDVEGIRAFLASHDVSGKTVWRKEDPAAYPSAEREYEKLLHRLDKIDGKEPAPVGDWPEWMDHGAKPRKVGDSFFCGCPDCGQPIQKGDAYCGKCWREVRWDGWNEKHKPPKEEVSGDA